PEIVVVGSTMMDMIAYVKRAPSSGETVIGDSFSLGFGGKGANQAVMASRFGAKVKMINTLGDDVFGETTLKNFQDQGIDTKYVNRVPGASGVAPIWVEADGSNRIICVPGTNFAMTVPQVQSALSEISEIDVLVGQLEIRQEVTAAAFAAARARGITTILNPAPFAPLSSELVKNSDWIIPNETEFAGLDNSGRAPDSDEVILELAKSLGCKLVVTLGEKGAALVENGKVVRVAAPSVNAIDTTGAGDAFVGAFSVGLGLGFEPEKAVKLGCESASLSVTRKGTQSSYPSRQEATQIISGI
ncbi:MAG: ribokinase, partial [Actinobacteria bacterium]|nr:ribokinase [Actinomycetota bacterium]